MTAPHPRLASLRALCDAATRGAWVPSHNFNAIRAPEDDAEHGGKNVAGMNVGKDFVVMHDGGQTRESIVANCKHIAAWSPDRARRFLDLAEAVRKLLDMVGSEVSYDSGTLLGMTVAARTTRAALAAALEAQP